MMTLSFVYLQEMVMYHLKDLVTRYNAKTVMFSNQFTLST